MKKTLHIDLDANLEANSEATQDGFKEVLAKVDEFGAKLKPSAIKLAENGWALPISLTMVQINALASEDIDIDESLLQHYTENNNEHIEPVLCGILNHDSCTPWTPLLKECQNSFYDERYLICIPALLIVLEGLLANKFGTRFTKNIRMIGQTKSKLHEFKPDSINHTVWLTIQSLIKTLFEMSDFSKNMPKNLNRHWTLHGRALPNEAKLNALKLIILISTLSVTPDKPAAEGTPD